jgi:hypoxanthine phosphoribosyltransferase
VVAQAVEYEAPSWGQIYTQLLKQAECICRSGFKPDIIVGICRGGWVPARVLSDLLDNPNLANVRTESYTGIGKAGDPILTQYISIDIKGKKVLVVDEVADSGRSLQLVVDYIQKQGVSEIKTATVYYKPTCAIKPDYYGKETRNWIIFPWDTKEALKEIFETYKDNSAQLAAEKKKLVAAGLPKQLITKFLKELSEAGSC